MCAAVNTAVNTAIHLQSEFSFFCSRKWTKVINRSRSEGTILDLKLEKETFYLLLQSLEEFEHNLTELSLVE